MDDTETTYQVGEFYTPAAEGGLPYDDPALESRVAAAGDRIIRDRIGSGSRSQTSGVRTQGPDDAGRGSRGPMILVDTALQAREAEGKPIRVGIIGAGFMARGLTNQIVNSVPGMRVVAIYNRKVAARRGRVPLRGTRAGRRRHAESARRRDRFRTRRRHRRRDAPRALRAVDVLVETTGSVEFGARVLLEAFKHGKDVVLLNAEIDATIGPILQVYAAQARRRPVGLRRRRAGRADQSVPLGQGPRPDAARHRQHQGTAGSLSHARRRRRASPRSGDRTPRWSPASPTVRRSASSRRSSPTPPASSSSRAACRAALEYRGDVMKIGSSTTSTKCAASAASSTTSSARR